MTNIKEIDHAGVILKGHGSADPDAKSLFLDLTNKKLFKQCYSCSIRIYEDNLNFTKTDIRAVLCEICGPAYLKRYAF